MVHTAQWYFMISDMNTPIAQSVLQTWRGVRSAQGYSGSQQPLSRASELKGPCLSTLALTKLSSAFSATDNQTGKINELYNGYFPHKFGERDNTREPVWVHTCHSAAQPVKATCLPKQQAGGTAGLKSFLYCSHTSKI